VRSGARRSMTYALQYAGSIRGAYRDAGMQDALMSFDERLEQALADANVALSDRQRQMLGLSGGGDTSRMPRELLPPGGNRQMPDAPSPDAPAPDAPAPGEGESQQ